MDRPLEAQDAIEEARAADPAAAASYDAEGLLADLQRDKARAGQAYAKAVERGSTSAYSHYRAAQLAWKPVSDPEGLAAIRKHLDRSIELSEPYAAAHAYLAEVMVQQDQAEAALPHAQRAVALDAGSTYNRVALARVLHKLGQEDAARAAAQKGLQLAADEAERSNAESFLASLDHDAEQKEQRAASQASQARFTACHNGDGEACAQLVPELERACGAGQAAACDFAGWIFAEGPGPARDPARAASFMQRACAAGDKRACVHQAWSQARGQGVAKDEAQGTAALEALCGDQLFVACTRLAVLYAGKGGAKDLARARELLAGACAGGEAEACSLAKTMPR
jgi:TPR repeat protein